MITKNKIKIGKTEFLVIDLTHPLKEDTEVYPGDPKPIKEIFTDIKKTGFQHHTYQLSDHHFHPHVDAPKHQNIDLQEKGVEIFDLEYCFNSAFLIDLSNSNEAENFDNIKYLIKVKKKHLEPFTKLFSQKKAVIIRTGYDKWLEANKPHIPQNIPYLSQDAAEFIAEFDNIKVVCIDSLTVDVCKEIPIHIAHQTLKDKMIVESIVNLHEIPIESRKDFDLQTSPIRIIGATGAPVIAYVFIKQ